MKKQNVVLVDFLINGEWDFIKGLECDHIKNWNIKCWDNAGLIRNKMDNIIRFWGYFSHSFEIFLHRKRYDKIIAWQQFYGIIFAFFCNLFKVKKVNKLIIMTFIYKEKKGIIGKIYEAFISSSIESDYVDKLIVFSRREVEYYASKFNIDVNKFQYYPLAIEDKKYTDQSRLNFGNLFLLAAGRSNRDYDFLIECAPEIMMPIVIVSDSLKMKSVPSNVFIVNDIGGTEFFKVLNESYAVIIPLKEKNISSGQLVMLQAMLYEKPIIITEAETIRDYVENGVNAIICKKEKKEFVSAVNDIISDSLKYNELKKNGKRIFEEKFSLYRLGRNIAYCLKEL